MRILCLPGSYHIDGRIVWQRDDDFGRAIEARLDVGVDLLVHEARTAEI